MNQLSIEIRRFKDLSVREIYEVLALRAEVFIMEQDCVYQDIDGKDTDALHLLGSFEGRLVGYARIFDSGVYFDTASIGRVLVATEYRHNGWGHHVMKTAIDAIEANFKTTAITISVQYYLLGFYKSHGFITQGSQYDEDGIPHIRMIRNLK